MDTVPAAGPFVADPSRWAGTGPGPFRQNFPASSIGLTPIASCDVGDPEATRRLAADAFTNNPLLVEMQSVTGHSLVAPVFVGEGTRLNSPRKALERRAISLRVSPSSAVRSPYLASSGAAPTLLPQLLVRPCVTVFASPCLSATHTACTSRFSHVNETTLNHYAGSRIHIMPMCVREPALLKEHTFDVHVRIREAVHHGMPSDLRPWRASSRPKRQPPSPPRCSRGVAKRNQRPMVLRL